MDLLLSATCADTVVHVKTIVCVAGLHYRHLNFTDINSGACVDSDTSIYC